MARKNNNRKRKAIIFEADDDDTNNNSNNKKITQWTPNEIQADPELYFEISKKLQCQPLFAAATLLGLACYHDIDAITLAERGKLVELVGERCPDVMAKDASLFCKLLDRGDKNFFMLLSRSPLMSTTSSSVSWNLDLAMLAVNKTPFFYRVLPKRLKQNNITLAMSAMMPSQKDIAAKNGTILRNIVKDVHHHCPDMFSQPSTSALQTILESDNVDLVAAVLIVFGDRIGWDDALAKFAKDHFPDCYSFFPAQYREDGVDAQKVMALLLPLKVTEEEFSYVDTRFQVDAVIAENPDFFADRHAVKQLFRFSNEIVTCCVIKEISLQLPWDKGLVCLAAKKWHHEYPRMAEKEMERIYKENTDFCKHHLPLGMLLFSIMAETVNAVNGDDAEDDNDDDEEEWPSFMNHCGCALLQDDAMLWNVLEFVERMLQRAVLAREGVRMWFLRLLHRIRYKFQTHQSFQTFLKCITVTTDEGGPLDVLFRGDDATSVALKRNIAEFLMGAPIQQESAASLKRDVLEIVYCLFMLPAEFRTETGSDAYRDPRIYESPFRNHGMFYYNLALYKLKEKYQDENDESESEEDSESSEDDWLIEMDLEREMDLESVNDEEEEYSE